MTKGRARATGNDGWPNVRLGVKAGGSRALGGEGLPLGARQETVEGLVLSMAVRSGLTSMGQVSPYLITLRPKGRVPLGHVGSGVT